MWTEDPMDDHLWSRESSGGVRVDVGEDKASVQVTGASREAVDFFVRCLGVGLLALGLGGGTTLVLRGMAQSRSIERF